MDEQIRTRQSLGDKTWSEESQTYYYSKFELFEDYSEINHFYEYSLFLERVSNELGEEWRQEAKYLYHPYFSSRDVFMNLLSIWLQINPLVNTLRQDPFFENSLPPVFNQNYTDEFIKRIQSLYEQRKGKEDPPLLSAKSTAAKAVCMGFFLTANEMWEEKFHSHKKAENKSFWIYREVSKTLEQSFRPLMVVTEKISTILGRKRVKASEPIEIVPQTNEMFEECFMEFRRTKDLEKQIERKMSDFCLEDEQGPEPDARKRVTKDQFQESEAPLKSGMLANLYDYITKFLKKQSSWQVANSFVTNILDITHSESTDEAKVKVLRPAEDFYEKLIITWILAIQSPEYNERNLSCDEYTEQAKIAFGRSWKQKYKVPIRYFHGKLVKHWSQIKQEELGVGVGQKQRMGSLIHKIRSSMKEDWERKIKIDKKNNLNDCQRERVRP